VRLYAFYEPLRTFTILAIPFLVTGLFLLARFAFFFLIGERGIGRFATSVSIGVGLLLVGVIIELFGIQADISSKHRQLTQETLYRLKKQELDREVSPTGSGSKIQSKEEVSIPGNDGQKSIVSDENSISNVKE
jgi:hypothetical protein